jgi:very-short-patch-repair endonuclease
MRKQDNINPSAEDIELRSVLDKMRERLLDLSNRNPLLNYRYPRSRCLRVVNEIPAQVFSRMLIRGGMSFVPLDPPDFGKDKAALPLFADSITSSAVTEEDETGSSITAMIKTRRRLEAQRVELARQLGIDPSYDLSAVPATDVPEHNDTKLQTLLRSDELEKLLHGLYRDSLTAIQETGANLLHFMFGAVNWQDVAGDQSNARVAPLVLVPVSLTRLNFDPRTGTYQYKAEATGEDWNTNVTLQVKCRKEFGFELPSINLEEDENLEAYFSKVEQLLEKRKGWSLRRQITLGLVSFGKILMWRDLDPATWPKGKPLLANSTLRQILGEPDEREARIHESAIIDEYPIDQLPAELSPAPLLVVDADSSQHSALIDVRQGKSMVIQGPPGTGKSQTITNMIADALSLGKKVLFVAEKKAALEVVYKRLVQAELGHFCLALHSHSSQKREFLDSLMERINARARIRRPQEFDSTRSLVEEARDTLNLHADRLHKPYFALQQTAFHILWRAHRLCHSFDPEAVTRIKELRVAGAANVTAESLARNRDALNRFAAEYRHVSEEVNDLAKHPWAGVRRADLNYAGVEQVIDAAFVWQQSLTVITDAVSELERMIESELFVSARSLHVLISTVQTFTPLPPQVAPGLLPAIISSAAEPGIQAAVNAVERARKAWGSVQGRWKERGAIDESAVNEFEGVLVQAEATFGSDLSLGQAESLKSTFRSTREKIDQVTHIVGEIQPAAGLDLPCTAVIAQRLAQVIRSFSGIDDIALSLRSEALTRPDAFERVESLHRSAAELISERDRLDKKFDPALRAEPAALRQHHEALSTAPAFLPWLFSGSYRKAVRGYRAMSGGLRVSRDEMRTDVKDLLTHLNKVDNLKGIADLTELFGSRANGLSTPLEKGISLLRWREANARLCRGLGEHGVTLESALWSGPAVQWREAQARAEHYRHELDACQTLPDELNYVARHTGQVATAWLNRDLADNREAIDRALELLKALGGIGQSAGASEAVTIKGLRLWLAALRDAWQADAALVPYQPLFASLSIPYSGAETDTASAIAALEYIGQLREAALPPEIEWWLLGFDPSSRLHKLREKLNHIEPRLEPEESVRREFTLLTELEIGTWLSATAVEGAVNDLADVPLSEQARRIILALKRSEALHAWALYQREKAKTIDAGLGAFCEWVENGMVSPSQVTDAYEAALYHTLATAIFRAEPGLSAFSGAAHGEIQQRFRSYDEALMEQVRRQISYSLNLAPAFPGRSYGRVADLTEEALIRHEHGKTIRHIPIRELFRRAGQAILAMKPCFLMGPHSVAQYLTPGLFEFDLIVMDEASQMRPEDALGAIARGKQLVVVGDPKQLGPTAFFDRAQAADEDIEDAEATLTASGDGEGENREEPPPPQGASVLERSESILHAAAGRYPTRMLRWHYRSKHPKLIAFSNARFYDHRLIIFPTSGVNNDAAGVFFHSVEGAVYLPKANLNEIEAKTIVQAVLQHAQNYPERSLLVATLNAKQAEMIDALIEEAEKTDSYMQEFRRRHAGTLEPFAIKNLENVQGDERDVIMVSITFGKASDGRFSQNFGPINRRGGERRLNVLFTRAKHRLDVFCSFNPADLRVATDSPGGLTVLREYLRYARGEDWANGFESGRPPDSDFETAVASALETRGYDVRCQIGVAGYFIDLGIVHPDHPGSFILGVECDGATYHSAKSARDRDRLREQILTQEYGWNIHRVWSTDWFRDPVRQVDSIIRQVELLLAREKRACS